MTARVEVADAVHAALDGERRGKRLVRSVADGFADPDAAAHSLIETLEADGVIVTRTPRLRGWCRALQKAIEGAR